MPISYPQVHQFPQTRWTLIRRVSEGTPEEVKAALNELCRSYWYPLYTIARMKGAGPEEAADFVQGFFAQGLATGIFAKADSQRGKLRTFLLSSFGHFVSNEKTRAAAKSRGGGCEWISIEDAESRFESELISPQSSVEKVYLRQWALSVLESALVRLRREYQARNDLPRFLALEPHLPPNCREQSQDLAAADMGISTEAFRAALHRLRKQYRSMILAEVSQTLNSDDPAEIQAEVHELMAALQ